MAAIVAHEVRNPLAGIKGAIQVLASRRTAGDADLPIMRDIIGRIDALGELINDLMLFARPRPPQVTAVSARALIDQAVEAVRRDPHARQVAISVEAQSDARLLADAELIRAAVLNLLLNAVQAMGSHGHLAVRLSATSDAAIIDVQDNGPGVPAELRERIFEPFFTTKARGGGLGLPIARRTAELHGGTLTLACPESGGTLASLTVPLNPPAAG
jgi:signal transduction histidine kinase